MEENRTKAIEESPLQFYMHTNQNLFHARKKTRQLWENLSPLSKSKLITFQEKPKYVLRKEKPISETSDSLFATLCEKKVAKQIVVKSVLQVALFQSSTRVERLVRSTECNRIRPRANIAELRKLSSQLENYDLTQR